MAWGYEAVMTIFKKIESEEQPCILLAIHAAALSSSATVLSQSPTAACSLRKMLPFIY